MNRLRIACIAAAASLVMSGAAQADDSLVPCKNHYILVDTCGSPPPPAYKGTGTFRFANVYSSPSGDFQLLQMVEVAGANGQHRFAGLELVATDRRGGVKRTTLTRDLPNERTARQAVLFATVGGDFTIPPNFLSAEGGTLELAGFDRWEYGPLPADGVGIIARFWPEVTASMLPYMFTGFFWGSEEQMGLTNIEHFVEFRHAASDRYFVTMLAAEIEALDSGREPGWTRTGDGFMAWINLYVDLYGGGVAYILPTQFLRPVCRLYVPPPVGPTHVYSVSEDECAAVARDVPGAILETGQAFLAAHPDAQTGRCSLEYAPLYRLWNGSPIGASHRYTPSKAARDAMVAQGWVAEGYGPDGVAMCTGGQR